ncbi:hypothetical protein M885DRAFT_586861 [Pelagophyceae sp. CCMP2097]|nr:hypothetical protein M885DRAFT_586861 [Pelagophyceae sp. CCMP2097]
MAPWVTQLVLIVGAAVACLAALRAHAVLLQEQRMGRQTHGHQAFAHAPRPPLPFEQPAALPPRPTALESPPISAALASPAAPRPSKPRPPFKAPTAAAAVAPPPPARPMSETAKRFHGLFLCSIGTPCPSYSAAFLTSRAQLLSLAVTEKRMRIDNTNMESASYHTMGPAFVNRLQNKTNVWRTIDALDFTVEHLSMYERMLQSLGSARGESHLGDAVYQLFLERLRLYEQRLRRQCYASDGSVLKRPPGRAQRTIGVMPLYAAGGHGSGHTRFEGKALYLNITIHGLRCHFGHVAVSCLHAGDRKYLEDGVGLPQIDDVLWVDPLRLPVSKPSFLGVATIRALQEKMDIDDGWRLTDLATEASRALWKRVDYVMYTEADQLVHLREQHKDKLFKALDERTGPLGLLTPHRLNAVPRTDDLAELVQAFHAPDFGGSTAAEAAALRMWRWGVTDEAYDAESDPWRGHLYGEQRAYVRRELEGYQEKRLVEVSTDLNDASCCYLQKGETSYPYGERGKAAGVRLDATLAGQFKEVTDRESDIDLMRIGENSLAILAGLCCQICARKSRLGRHCDNYCVPKPAGESDCAVGEYADA